MKVIPRPKVDFSTATHHAFHEREITESHEAVGAPRNVTNSKCSRLVLLGNSSGASKYVRWNRLCNRGISLVSDVRKKTSWGKLERL